MSGLDWKAWKVFPSMNLWNHSFNHRNQEGGRSVLLITLLKKYLDCSLSDIYLIQRPLSLYWIIKYESCILPLSNVPASAEVSAVNYSLNQFNWKQLSLCSVHSYNEHDERLKVREKFIEYLLESWFYCRPEAEVRPWGRVWSLLWLRPWQSYDGAAQTLTAAAEGAEIPPAQRVVRTMRSRVDIEL